MNKVFTIYRHNSSCFEADADSLLQNINDKVFDLLEEGEEKFVPTATNCSCSRNEDWMAMSEFIKN
jgi:hypothetical protein